MPKRPASLLSPLFAILAILATAAIACSSSSSPAGSTCTAAGGTCILGGATCTKEAATSAQDCNPGENPGGAFCCLTRGDGGPPSTDAGKDARTKSDGSLPACTWPASLDRTDAADTACVASRTYDVCVTGAGGGTQCGVSACAPDEYAVACGGPGPAKPPPLPTGCKSAVSGPGGGVAGCCPCGS